MTHYAAYDHNSIYALGATPDEAVANARRDAGDDDAKFFTATVSDALAEQIERDGWNGNSRSFDIKNGQIVDTTES